MLSVVLVVASALLSLAQAAEFQSLLAGEFVRGISIAPSVPHVVTFQPTPQANANTGVAFRVFFCRGGADMFLTIGAGRMPTPTVNQFEQLYVRNVDAQAAVTGPGNLFYNLALYPAASTPANATVLVDVVAASSQAAIDAKIPTPGGDGALRIKSKVDRTNTIAWTPTGTPGDSYQVWVSTEQLPTADITDGRTPDTACGAEAAMTKRGDALTAPPSGGEMTFDVTDVTGVQTAAVVVTRSGGYKAVYVSAWLTVQGGQVFTNVDGGTVTASARGPGGANNTADGLALTAASLFVAAAAAL